MIDITDAYNATERLKPWINSTPTLRIPKHRVAKNIRATLKLECLQLTGAFKIRGALNSLLSLRDDQRKRGVVTASGGNHGKGIALAAKLLATRATVFVPESTPISKRHALTAFGATLIVAGEVWDDAEQAALDFAESEGIRYVHPFADPDVIAGQATVGFELFGMHPELDKIYIPVGGGGLASGIAIARDELSPKTRLIGVEPLGAPTLHDSISAGRAIRLGSIDTKAGTLAPRSSTDDVVEWLAQSLDEVVLVSDDELLEAARDLWSYHGLAVELAGAASWAAIRRLGPAGSPVSIGGIACGAGDVAIKAR